MVRRLLVLGVASVALWFAPGVAQAASASSHVVAVVIDFADGTHPTLVGCVREPNGTTDAQALDDLLNARGLATSRYSNSGLLCAIGNVPTSGCGTQTANGYQYWAYFHGNVSGWAYANDGPAERTSSAQRTAGFRFEPNGKGTSADPVPSTSSNPATLCASQRVVSTTTTSSGQPHSSSSSLPLVMVVGGAVLLVGGALIWRRAQR
jgi:hypothetical protein